MRVRLVSRASELARLQARLVARALAGQQPALELDFLVRSSAGDRDQSQQMWQSIEKGLFTSDLSESLLSGEADVAVHSWKDLPIEGRHGTAVAATLPRADPRDLLLIRSNTLSECPCTVAVLTSSPRRAWQLESGLPELLPWAVSATTSEAVRGNVPTRLEKLFAGTAHGLVVAKAAIDRLLSDEADSSVRRRVRERLDQCVWTVLPLSEFPTAPAQGALAAEVAVARPEMWRLVSSVDDGPTRAAVDSERALLSGFGGGCHTAVGATVLVREYGTITSARGVLPSGEIFRQWELRPSRPLPPPVGRGALWPQPAERHQSIRRPLATVIPSDARGWWVARAEALPPGVVPDARRIVWSAGTRTWRKLAARGIWVHGCADGLGDGESPAIDALAGRSIEWLRLSHADSPAEDVLATYDVQTPLPGDLGDRTHFFWTSGTLFLEALQRHPGIGRAWHACGPGRTFRTIVDALGDDSRVSVWLDYERWHEHVNRQ